MNANAYGGELGRALAWVDVSTAGRDHGGARRSSGSPTGGRTWGRARSLLAPRLARALVGRGDQGGARRHAARRREGGPAVGDQDVRLDVQEPRRRPGGGPHRRPAARGGGLQGASRSGAPGFSPKHANLVENMGGRARTADVLALIAEGPASACVTVSAWTARPRCSCSESRREEAERAAEGPARKARGRRRSRGGAVLAWFGWGWFRESSLVQVRHVEIAGVSNGPDAAAIRAGAGADSARDDEAPRRPAGARARRLRHTRSCDRSRPRELPEHGAGSPCTSTRRLQRYGARRPARCQSPTTEPSLPRVPEPKAPAVAVTAARRGATGSEKRAR